MMLTVAALVLLGVTVLTVNRNNLQQGTILHQTEVGVYAISLATSYLERSIGYDFDQATAGDAMVFGETELSTTLGRETGEIANQIETWNDFDDFNGMNKKDTVAGVDIFTTQAIVYYVQPTTPNVSTTTRTFFKRIDVKTFSNTGGDTIKLSHVYSYFY